MKICVLNKYIGNKTAIAIIQNKPEYKNDQIRFRFYNNNVCYEDLHNMCRMALLE